MCPSKFNIEYGSSRQIDGNILFIAKNIYKQTENIYNSIKENHCPTMNSIDNKKYISNRRLASVRLPLKLVFKDPTFNLISSDKTILMIELRERKINIRNHHSSKILYLMKIERVLLTDMITMRQVGMYV